MLDEGLLTRDHAELDVLLNRVFEALDGVDNGVILENLDLFWGRLAVHIRAEHLHLFPAALAYCENTDSISPKISEKLELLRHDHDFFMHELARAVKLIRAVSEDNAGATYMEIRSQLHEIEQRLSEHNLIEETEVYPLMQAVMAQEGFNDLNARLKRELDNLPPRFRKNASE